MEIGYPRLSFTERFREWVFSPIVESGKVYFLVFFVPLSKESHLSKEVWELSLWRKNKNIFKSNNYSRVAIAGSTWISDAPTATSTPTPTSSIIGLESLRISPRTLSFTFKLKSKRGFQPISISVAGALELKRNYLAGTMWKGGRVASLLLFLFFLKFHPQAVQFEGQIFFVHGQLHRVRLGQSCLLTAFPIIPLMTLFPLLSFDIHGATRIFSIKLGGTIEQEAARLLDWGGEPVSLLSAAAELGVLVAEVPLALLWNNHSNNNNMPGSRKGSWVSLSSSLPPFALFGFRHQLFWNYPA